MGRVWTTAAAALLLAALAGCGGGDTAPAATAAAAAPQQTIEAAAAATAKDGGGDGEAGLDAALQAELRRHGYSGRVAATLEPRLGRKVDARLADLGRQLFFDSAVGLRGDNACAGCHAPAAGMGDTQSIAIGIQNNGIVGPGRSGPRNQRRTPTVVNSAFYPKLMWNGRFSATGGDPFSNALGFEFPLPEGTTRFAPGDPLVTHLLVAQAHIPPTELVEVAGFRGVTDLGPRFLPFDDGIGTPLPAADASGFRNEPIRQSVLQRLNALPAYRTLFGASFPAVATGAPIDFTMFGRAVAEFEFTLVRADAPLDRYARGDARALDEAQKRGALLFFGKGRCVACHAVAGESNQMFSDFRMHNIGVPQVAPAFGVSVGNVVFDGAGEDEDFGLAQVTGAVADRYKFRSSPLRNVALQPAFFHNGAYTRLDDAIRHHLDAARSARSYAARRAGVARDLQSRQGPVEPVLATLDPLLRDPIRLSEHEFGDLLRFVADGLLDPKARANALCPLVPKALPSGQRLPTFQGC